MAEKYTEAQKKASLKYQSKTVAIQFRVSQEKRALYQEKAEAEGKSLSQFIIDTLDNCTRVQS